jgi:membrane peptidoglycan carboxypeptidase
MEALVQPGSGKIQGIAISRKYGLDKYEAAYDYAVDIAHGGGGGNPAGSTFKIFTLAAALLDGVQLSDTISTSSTETISGYTDCNGNSTGAPWTVSNSEKSETGANDLETGTWSSINTYYAQLEKQVGLCKVATMAGKFGMTLTDGSPLKQIPSFTLGTNNIDIVHEAAAYAGFAASGKYCKPIAINGIMDSRNRQLAVPSVDCKQVLDANVANEVTKILKGVITRGTAKGNSLSDGRPAAGKTGTNENLTTALFAGYTMDMASVVWYGNPDRPFGDPVGEYGASLAPLWRQTLEEALAGIPATDFPDPGNSFGSGGAISSPKPNNPVKSPGKKGGGTKGAPKGGGPKH